jgi:hypothetical protein
MRLVGALKAQAALAHQEEVTAGDGVLFPPLMIRGAAEQVKLVGRVHEGVGSWETYPQGARDESCPPSPVNSPA